jgi:LTXXQ motif family protein
MNKKPLFFSVVAVGLAVGLTHAAAQQRGQGSGMMGPGMMDRDPPMDRGGMMGMMGGCPMMGADGQASTFIDGRLAFLKAELAITDAQKAAWDAYADATKRNLESIRGMWQTMRTVLDTKTPVERLDAHLAAMESRIKVLQEVKPTLAKLYEALSVEQKKKADEILTGMGCMM